MVAPDDEAETMGGGLYIPETAKEKPTQGRLIALGAGRMYPAPPVTSMAKGVEGYL